MIKEALYRALAATSKRDHVFGLERSIVRSAISGLIALIEMIALGGALLAAGLYTENQPLIIMGMAIPFLAGLYFRLLFPLVLWRNDRGMRGVVNGVYNVVWAFFWFFGSGYLAQSVMGIVQTALQTPISQ